MYRPVGPAPVEFGDNGGDELDDNDGELDDDNDDGELDDNDDGDGDNSGDNGGVGAAAAPTAPRMAGELTTIAVPVSISSTASSTADGADAQPAAADTSTGPTTKIRVWLDASTP